MSNVMDEIHLEAKKDKRKNKTRQSENTNNNANKQKLEEFVSRFTLQLFRGFKNDTVFRARLPSSTDQVPPFFKYALLLIR